MSARLGQILDTRGIFVVLLFTGIFALTVRDVNDPDLWWHLATGKYIVQHRAVPPVDPFSFTRQGQPWIAHEWLSDLIIYGVYRAFGWAGLLILFGLFTTAGFVFLCLRCLKQPYLAGVVILWSAFACRPTWGIRPQTLSILLASILLWLLDRSGQSPRRLWWIVPLMLLWANLHAGYALGIALLILYLTGDRLDSVFGSPSKNESRTRTLAAVMVLSLFVVALNPNGLRLYLYPIQTLQSSAMQNSIAEWFSPNFHRAEYAPFLFTILALLALVSVSPRRLRPGDLLLVCATAYGGLQSVRHIPIFVLVAAPVLTAQGAAVLANSQLVRLPTISGSPNLARAVFHAAILAMAGIFVCFQTLTVIRRQPTNEAATFPAGAVAFLNDHHPPGPILNHYNWGGYLIWRLYPEYPVFIDGRADLYGDAFMKQFSDTYSLTGNWQSSLEQWHIRTAVIPPDCPLAAALLASGSWTVLFRDAHSLVLTRP